MQETKIKYFLNRMKIKNLVHVHVQDVVYVYAAYLSFHDIYFKYNCKYEL